MGFFTFATNTLILFTLLYHTLTYYKNKIQKTTNKNHPYVFIIMSLLLSFDQITNLNNFITWYWIKYLFIFLLCFPGSTLGHKLYKEYIERACLLFGDAMEEICADGILCLYNKSKVYITEVIDYVNALVRRRGDLKEAIEFKEIQGNSEDGKNE